MAAQWLVANAGLLTVSLGLALDMVGAALIFKYGLPPDDASRDGVQVLATQQRNERSAENARKYDKRSATGFWMLIIGFAFQLVGNWGHAILG